MQRHLSVDVRATERSVILAIDGELDLASSREVEETIRRIDGAPSLVIDLANLRFIDMAGLRVLIAAHERAGQEGQRLVLANISPPVRRILALTRVGDLLPIVEGEVGA